MRGPLHGGANEAVIRTMLDLIKKKENVIPWAKKKLEKREKIMGFGHRVYKTWDPRAKILRELSKKFWEKKDRGEIIDKISDVEHNLEHGKIDNIFEMTDILTNFMIKTKNIYPNDNIH